MNLSGQIIAVTGATGFLGSHLVDVLLARQAKVVAVVRNPDKGRDLAARGVELRKADLADRAALTEAFRGCDAVVSNAALAVRGGASQADYRAANVDGTVNVFEAIAAAGVGRAVHVSSVAVYRARAVGPIDETTPLRERFHPDLTMFTTDWRYSMTKAEGERAAWEIARRSGVGLTVVRPGPIYGSRDPKMTASILGWLKHRVLPVPTVTVPMVHAGDVAIGVASALEREATAGRSYNMGGLPMRLHELFRLLVRLQGSGPRVIPVWVPLGVRFNDGLAEKELGFVHRSPEAGWGEVLRLGAGSPS
jgi:nucleoside-diphosphate-sugar epimerase